MLKSLASRVSFWHRALFSLGRCRGWAEAGESQSMTTLLAPELDRALRALPQSCRLCGTRYPAAAEAVCGECLGPLEPSYDPDRPLPDTATISARPETLWRYREWLPFEGEPALSLDSGFTPLVESPRLARALGVARLWLKNDAVSHPSLSFKDRVVASALNAARALGIGTVGCASTGNLANAVAAQAARAGLPAWIFIPHDLELGKVVGTAVYGPRLVRVRGTYDDVNRLCAQAADRYGWGLVNINLRGYYGEGSKTVAFEICEQLGWRTPTAVVAPMAGGSLVTKLDKGFAEFLSAGLVSGPGPRLFGAQAQGCAPIVRLVESGGDRLDPVVPDTIARSIAIGNPADGRFAAEAIRRTGGWVAGVPDPEIVAGIRLLAESSGIFTETAGGATVAGALALARAGRLRPDDEVVLCITGNGLKTVEALQGALPESPVIAPRLRELEALYGRDL
jgi:threonine synthase